MITHCVSNATRYMPPRADAESPPLDPPGPAEQLGYSATGNQRGETYSKKPNAEKHGGRCAVREGAVSVPIESSGKDDDAEMMRGAKLQ
jgi:hypothetical protein